MRLLAGALAALLAATAARADVAPLKVDPKTSLSISLGSLALAAGLNTSYAPPSSCRICGAGSLDRDARDDLVWKNPAAAGTASDILVSGVIPAAVLLNSGLSAWAGGEPYAAVEDTLVITEALSLSTALNAISKDAFARRRPSASLEATGAANRSFYSGHTQMAFSLAAAAGTVSTLRGYESAPWVWAGGMALASAVGYLRIAADAHWLTDVAAGAAVGGAIGFLVPWTFHRVHGAARGAVDVVPAPGGFALVW